MFYTPDARPELLRHNPFKALVAPRPIGWISTLDRDGRPNLAPYSFFNAVGDLPPLVMFAPNGLKAGEGDGEGKASAKDTLRNVLDTGEFVVNLVGFEQRDAMNASSAALPAGVDEFEVAGLEKRPSEIVAPPRVAGAPAALECRLVQHVALPCTHPKSRQDAVFGEVVGIHIDEAVIVDGMVDVTLFRPVARLGYKDYASVDAVFQMGRPAG